MELFKNKYNFVREELKDLPEFSELPKGKLKDFTSRIKYALLLGLKEKEIFFFGAMQWLSVVVLVVMGVGGAAASAGGEPSVLNLDKNILHPGIQIMPLDSRFEVNTLTLEKLDFHNDFDFNKTSINLLELKYKFN